MYVCIWDDINFRFKWYKSSPHTGSWIFSNVKLIHFFQDGKVSGKSFPDLDQAASVKTPFVNSKE